MALERELDTFQKELPRLLAEGKAGQFVLIRGEELAGTWDTFEKALTAGYDRYGLEQFLVKQIGETEKPVHFSRNVR